MSIHRWLAAGLLVVLIAPLSAQDKPKDEKPKDAKPEGPKPVKLEWKFEKDKPFYQTVVIESSNRPKPPEAKPEGVKPEGGKPEGTKPEPAKPEKLEPDTRQTFYLSWTPLKPDDNKWTFKMKIEGVSVHFAGPGTKIDFDSTKDEKPTGSLASLYSKLVGAEVTLTLNSEMQATKVEGNTELVKELKKTDPQLEKMVDALLTEDAFKQLATVTFPPLKKGDVKKGDTWERRAGLSADFLGSYNVTYTYTDDGPEAEGNREKIGIKGAVAYSATSLPLAFQPFKVFIKGTDFKTHEVSGNFDFLKDKGRVGKLTQTLTLAGTLIVESGGKSHDVEVNLVQTTTVTTADENPVKKK